MAYLILALLLGACTLAAQPSVITYHNDNARTGLYPNETLLTPANVKAGRFGKRRFLPVDGQVYAQPLYLARVKIAGKGLHNVLFVATSHDSLYAFDADDESGSQPLWKLSFLDASPGATTASQTDVNCTVIPELGITGTPVIDPALGTIYLIALTKEPGNQFVYKLHGIDVSSGLERPGSPVEIQAPGFVPLAQKQRTALLLSNGVIYSSWSGHCDQGTYHGYVMAHDAVTLKQVGIFNATPADSGASFWNGGAGPAADAEGNIYAVSANGDFDGNLDAARYDESVLKLAPAPQLSVLDLFTPFDRLTLDGQDLEIGSSGALLLPDETGNPAHPHLMFVSGKEGRMYLLDRQALGGAQMQSDLDALASLPVLNSHATFGMAAYFNNSIYIVPADSPLFAFHVAGASLASSPRARTSITHFNPGATPSISSNGASNGIVWVIAADDGGRLLAYDAASLGLLYDTSAQPSDQPAIYAEFTVPTVVDGRVYAGGVQGITVYGELAPHPPAVSAVTNAASFVADAVSPGSLITVFGSHLAAATSQANSTPLPLSLVDTSVTVNGLVAPLLFVSENQINAQIPAALPAGPATIVVRSGGLVSPPTSILIQPAAPGLFANSEGGAVALDDDDSPNSEAAPASSGSVVSVFLTGLGPVSTPIDDGVAPSAGETIGATLTVTATIGGVPAAVEFAGLAPLYPGTAQVNLRVPPLASGTYPLIATIGGTASNTVHLVISAH